MDFTIEDDQWVRDDLDVVAETGGRYRILTITTTTPVFVRDGTVTITMNAVVDAAILSAVEVIASANQPIHRINCGATSNTPVIMNQVSWTKDAYALSGARSNRCAANNITDSIYCSSRYFSATFGTPLRYSIPVPYYQSNNARYAVRLHFNEHHYNSVGQRVFHVLVQGTRVLTNFDIIRDAPGENTPMVIALPNPVTVTSSAEEATIVVEFVELTGHPHIHGIEIIYIGPPVAVPVAAPVRLPTRVPVPVAAPVRLPARAPVVAPLAVGTVLHRINCGSATSVTTTSPNSVVWSPDQYSNGGVPYNTCGTNSNTSIYCTSRYFQATDPTPFRYNLPVTGSSQTYTVRMHFAEQVRSFVRTRIDQIFVWCHYYTTLHSPYSLFHCCSIIKRSMSVYLMCI